MNHHQHAAGLKRRRAAADRLPPLDNGHRDPDDHRERRRMRSSTVAFIAERVPGAILDRDDLVEAWHDYPDARDYLKQVANLNQGGWAR